MLGDSALVATSDLHVERAENRRIVEGLRPEREGDWLIVCGDVCASLERFEWAMRLLAGRFARVIWVPGNHELWSRSEGLRGEARYLHLVELCRGLGVLTPEDPYPVWTGPGGPVVVAPLFTLYDYSFGRNVGSTKAESLARAHEAGIVCSDEFLLSPDPYETVDDWCRERVRLTLERLEAEAGDRPTVLAGHFPLLRDLTSVLMYPVFAQWCGTELTADWHLRFHATAVVYGHLHIPRTTIHDGVRFEEVSVGYPRERARRPWSRPPLRRILPPGVTRAGPG
jgi:3',5'-cyclic AMP phosphodiesterase CpdA